MLAFQGLDSGGKGEVHQWRDGTTLRHSVAGHSRPTIGMQLAGLTGGFRTVRDLVLLEIVGAQ